MEDAAAVASLPSENPPPQVTPEDAARAAVKVVLEKQDAENAQAVRDQYTIVDPGQKAAPSPTEEKPEPTPVAKTESKPEPKIEERLLERIAALEERLSARTEYEPVPQNQEEPLIALPSKRKNAEGQEETIDWEPEVVEFANKTNKTVSELRAEVNRLKESDQQREQRLQFQARELKSQAFDQWAAKETSIHDVIGTGDRATATKQEFAVRNQIYMTAESIENVYRQSGQRPPSWEECCERAKAAILPEKVTQAVKSATQKELSDRLRDSAGKYISRPNPVGKVSDLPKGDARAKAALAQELRKQGYDSYD